MSTVSTKPYLIRAIWEWCVDQGYTPYMAARVDAHTLVPPGFARDGQIVLNLGPEATHKLAMENDFISFQARFNGVQHSLLIPVANVLAVYARENGHGMAFDPEPEPEEDEAAPAATDEAAPVTAPAPSASAPRGGDEPPRPRGGHLKVVK
jgi:stringent starvation protein B